MSQRLHPETQGLLTFCGRHWWVPLHVKQACESPEHRDSATFIVMMLLAEGHSPRALTAAMDHTPHTPPRAAGR